MGELRDLPIYLAPVGIVLVLAGIAGIVGWILTYTFTEYGALITFVGLLCVGVSLIGLVVSYAYIMDWWFS